MRNTDHRPRRIRPSVEPAYPEESPHDFPGADIRPAANGKILVTAPHRQYYERWLYKQQEPERYQYVYRIEQLQGVTDTTILAIGGGNPQLLSPPDYWAAFRLHAKITVEYLD